MIDPTVLREILDRSGATYPQTLTTRILALAGQRRPMSPTPPTTCARCSHSPDVHDTHGCWAYACTDDRCGCARYLDPAGA